MEEHLKNLENIIGGMGEALEGNCVYIDRTLNRSDDLKNKQLNLQHIAKGKKRICEIGFNGGHSMLMFLYDNPSVEEVLIFDICEHKYLKPSLEYLKSKFQNVSFTLIEGDTRETLPDYFIKARKPFELIHCDGGHQKDVVKNDMKYCRMLGEVIIVDDTNHGPINDEANNLLNDGWIELKILQTKLYEHRMFIVG